jgi:hypothetical protein
MWIVIGITLGLATLGALVLAVSRPSDRGRALSSGDLMGMGVAFTAVGASTMVTIGPAMLGMLALGLVFMWKSVRMKRGGS